MSIRRRRYYNKRRDQARETKQENRPLAWSVAQDALRRQKAFRWREKDGSYDQYYFRGGGFGDNCVSFILEIAETADIKLALGHLMDMPDDVELFIENSGKVVKGFEEYSHEYGAARFGDGTGYFI